MNAQASVAPGVGDGPVPYPSSFDIGESLGTRRQLRMREDGVPVEGAEPPPRWQFDRRSDAALAASQVADLFSPAIELGLLQMGVVPTTSR